MPPSSAGCSWCAIPLAQARPVGRGGEEVHTPPPTHSLRRPRRVAGDDFMIYRAHERFDRLFRRRALQAFGRRPSTMPLGPPERVRICRRAGTDCCGREVLSTSRWRRSRSLPRLLGVKPGLRTPHQERSRRAKRDRTANAVAQARPHASARHNP